MEWVEVTGKTVEEAKDKALDLLGVDETQAEFEILEEPRVSGLFRRLKGEARVRARIKPVRPRAKAERRDRRRGRGPGDGSAGRGEGRGESRGDGRGESRGEGRAAGGGRGRPARGNGRGPRPEQDASTETDRGREAAGADEVTGVESPRDTAAGVVGRRVAADGRGGTADAGEDRVENREHRPATPDEGAASRTGRSQEGKLQVQDELDTNQTEPERERSDDDGADREDTQGQDAKAFVEALVGAFGLEATVDVQRVDDYLDEVQVTGSDLGILIGPKAATLEAVQELTRVAVQRRLDGRSDLRLRVDIGAYRQRRREALERFARKLADEVRETGVQKVLEPMGSADRKVIHDTVGQLEGVRTLSEGEDPRRRVVIVPAG